MCLAVPGRLLDVQGEDILDRRGRVSFGGVVKEVCLSCVPEAREGDFVLVHVGVAISVIDEEEAGEVFRYLRSIGDLGDLEAELPESP
jgi:hydrogenase expression/formation protein HypC